MYSFIDNLALADAELDLAHYHESIRHGLRAGIHRASTISSVDSVGSSLVIYGTPGM